VDAASGQVTRHAETLQAYSDDAYRALLAECGFGGITFYASLRGDTDETQPGLIAILARKPDAR
jgi:hypothetical protein